MYRVRSTESEQKPPNFETSLSIEPQQNFKNELSRNLNRIYLHNNRGLKYLLLKECKCWQRRNGNSLIRQIRYLGLCSRYFKLKKTQIINHYFSNNLLLLSIQHKLYLWRTHLRSNFIFYIFYFLISQKIEFADCYKSIYSGI